MNPSQTAVTKDTIAELQQLINEGLVDKRDQGFCESLILGFKKYGKLSEKQTSWVFKMIERALFGNAKPKQKETEEVGSFAGVIEIFNKAKESIKYPKINLDVPDGSPVQLSMAGPNAQQPGTINITDGRPYGQNNWYGRVTPDGSWGKSNKRLQGLSTLLKELSENPHLIAMRHGHKTNTCCFCNKVLSHPNSVAAGYGETCSKNWNLHSEWKNVVNVS